MISSAAARPEVGEHHPYYTKYIDLVPEPDAIAALEGQLADMTPLLERITEEKGAHRYAPEKWTVKSVLQHLIDGERVFAYRALRAARADQTPLPGFDENTFAEMAGAESRPVKSLVEEMKALRRANLAMFAGLEEAAWQRRVKANDAEVSVRALAFIIAGHARHHVKLLRERYGCA